MRNKEKSRRRQPSGENSDYACIVAHPAQFCKELPEKEKQDAVSEYVAIIGSNPLAPLSAWFRRTKHEAVKSELKAYFRQASRNELMPL